MSSSLIKALINSTIKEENKLQPLTITCTASNLYSATVKFEVNGSPNISGLQYRKGTSAEWEQLSVPTTLYIPTGESWQFQNTNDTLSNSASNYLTIQLDSGASVKLTGNINSLVNYKELSTYCFYNLFKLSRATIDASELILPDTVANECYNNMFNFCKGLITAPALPAKVLATGCYSNMFKDCQNLITAPELPATSLVDYCYNQMFQSCYKLKYAPALPATTLKPHCYNSMFKYCTSLVEAPELPATSLAMYCYNAMFANCTKLTTAPFLPATSLYTGCYNEMFQSCSSLNYIKVGFSDYYLGNYSNNWVQNVSPTGTFASTSRFNTLKFGPSAIPEGWAVEGRNIIYGSDETISYEINKDFQLNVNFKALPETTAPATVTILEGTLPEGWSINGTTILGNSSSFDKISLKVKIEIAGYESYQKTINFNFYEEAKLTDYKLYIPLNNVDTAIVKDGDNANAFYLTQYSNSYKVNTVEISDESGDKLIKCSDFGEGSGNTCPTLVGNNAAYQNLLKGNNPWTIAFKAYFKGCAIPSGKTNNVIQIGSAYGAGKRLRFGLRPINDRFYLYLDTYNIDDIDETQAEARSFDLNTWYNIVVTYENRTLKYYYNNVLVATTTISADLALNITGSYGAFYIGGYTSEYAWRNNSPNCYMKDLLLFNKVLTEDEIKTLNSSDTGDEEDTPSVTYLYTVSGSSHAEANGDYWQDGTLNGKGKYTNGNCDMVWIGSYWAIGPIGYNGSGAPYHACWEDIATPISSSWSGVTVTEYAGNSGEGGEGGGGSTADYTVTGAGTAAVNGYYYNTGETKGNYPVYANSNGVKLWFFHLMGGWVFSPDSVSESTAVWYYHCEAHGDVTTGNWANDALYPSVDALGAAPLPTVTKGGGEGGGESGGDTPSEPDEPEEPQGADYTVSGAVSVPEANGEYVEDGTLNDRPKYVNTSNSNAIIRFDATVGWSVFYMGQPKYTTMDTASATPPVSATWKYGSETVTVTKGS